MKLSESSKVFFSGIKAAKKVLFNRTKLTKNVTEKKYKNLLQSVDKKC